MKHPKTYFDDRPKLMTEFARFYKNVKFDIGFELRPLTKKDFFVKCNEPLSVDPFKIFKALNFRESFSNAGRVRFLVKIIYVGKMIQPNSWDDWLGKQ